MPTNTSQFLVTLTLVLWLIGCLVKTVQNEHLKLSPQSHILFLSLFFTRNIVSPPGKYPWQELFKSLRVAYFSKFGIESCPPAKRGADTVRAFEVN